MSPQRRSRLARSLLLASLAVLGTVEVTSGAVWLACEVAWRVATIAFWPLVAGGIIFTIGSWLTRASARSAKDQPKV